VILLSEYLGTVRSFTAKLIALKDVKPKFSCARQAPLVGSYMYYLMILTVGYNLKNLKVCLQILISSLHVDDIM